MHSLLPPTTYLSSGLAGPLEVVREHTTATFNYPTSCNHFSELKVQQNGRQMIRSYSGFWSKGV
jgi:hypothetical protein